MVTQTELRSRGRYVPVETPQPTTTTTYTTVEVPYVDETLQSEINVYQAKRDEAFRNLEALNRKIEETEAQTGGTANALRNSLNATSRDISELDARLSILRSSQTSAEAGQRQSVYTQSLSYEETRRENERLERYPRTITRTPVGATTLPSKYSVDYVKPSSVEKVVSKVIEAPKIVIKEIKKSFSNVWNDEPIKNLRRSVSNIFNDKPIKNARIVIGTTIGNLGSVIEPTTRKISSFFDKPTIAERDLTLYELETQKRLEGYNLAVEEYNKKYGGKELSEEEYKKATTEAERLSRQESGLTGSLNYIEKRKEVYEKQKEREPFLLVSSFAKGVVEAPLTYVTLGSNLILTPTKTLGEQKRGLLSLPRNIISKPFSTLGYLGGQIFITEAGLSLLRTPKKVPSKISAIQKAKYESYIRKVDLVKIGIKNKVGKLEYGEFVSPRVSGRIDRGVIYREVISLKEGGIARGMVLSTTKAGRIKAMMPFVENLATKKIYSYNLLKPSQFPKGFERGGFKFVPEEFYGGGKVTQIVSKSISSKVTAKSGISIKGSVFKEKGYLVGDIKGKISPEGVWLTLKESVVKQRKPELITSGKGVGLEVTDFEGTGFSLEVSKALKERTPVLYDVIKSSRVMKKTPFSTTFGKEGTAQAQLSLGNLKEITSLETTVGAVLEKPKLLPKKIVTQTETSLITPTAVTLLSSSLIDKEDIKQLSNIVSKNELKIKEKVVTKSEQEGGSLVIPKPRISERTIQAPKENIKLKVTQVQAQQLKQKLRQQLTQLQMTIPRMNIPTPITPKIPIPTMKNMPKMKLPSKIETGFEAIGLRFGKEVKLGKGTKEQTERKVEAFLSGTLGASAFLKKGGEKIRAKETNLLKIPSFRESKVNPYLIVERKEKRLKRGTSETQEIKMFNRRRVRNFL